MFEHWESWPCTRACTAFFHVAKEELEPHVPPTLGIFADRRGRGQIELGYVRFRAGIEGLPPTDELAWAIRVERVKGSGMAFLAMNIAASEEPFLAHQARIGFAVHRPPATFRPNGDASEIRIGSGGAPICVMRDRAAGRLPIPTLPGDTEVWTRGPDGALARRLFKWKGMANVLPAPSVAWTLHPHPFFLGLDVTQVEPLPVQVLASDKLVARAEQRFTAPTPG